MSTESKKYRAEMRAKANRMGNAKSPKSVDASDWSPSEPLNADRKTGARPLRSRIYKMGGKIQGDRAPKNAGKAPRGGFANGGKATGPLSMTSVPDENKKAKGSFHTGGYKKGGRAEKCGGGPMAKGGEVEKDEKQDKKEIKTAIHKHDKQQHGGKLTKGLKKGGEADSMGGRVERATGGKNGPPWDSAQDKSGPPWDSAKEGKKDGGRAARAKGGRARGPTKINIIIGAGGPGSQQPNMPPPQAPVRPPPPPQNVPPPGMGGPPPGMGGPPPGPPPGPPGGPPGMPPGGPPMMRKRGGRAGYMSLKAGGGSGLGRLHKAHAAE